MAGKNLAFMINDVRAIPLIKQLCYKNCKKAGEGVAEEAVEVSKRHPEWVTIIGSTDYDADMLTGNLRERGMKILNLNELKRRKENQQ